MDAEIVPAYTYTASASVVAHVGATIVLVDSQKDNVEMDYDKLADAITERTKVIVPVEIADFSSFSFHAVKNFTTAEGGALTWNLPFGNEKVERQQVYCGSPVPFIEGES